MKFDHDQLKAEFKAIRSEPLPPNRKHLGCGFLLLVPPMLMLGPKVAGATGVIIAIIVAVVALVGGYLTLFGGNKELREIRDRAGAALYDLATSFDSLTEEQRRQAALRALAYASYDQGPGSFDTYNVELEAARLGVALPYVQEIERILVAQSLIKPVFTRSSR